MVGQQESCLGNLWHHPANPDIKNYDFLLHTGVQATYSSGQVVDFDVDMTAHHKGHFVLKACVVPPGQRATQACFDRNPLRFISGHGANPPELS